MTKQVSEEKPVFETGTPTGTVPTNKRAVRWAFIFGIVGIVVTILMAVGIVVYKEQVQALQNYGYVGAFFISILGGATVIVPVPMLAVVFALGGVMEYPWLVAIAAALGELIGALTIYLTGRGAGHAISKTKHNRIQKAYEKCLKIIERWGAVALFIITCIVNPFFYPAAFAAGALRIGLKKYIFVVLAGKLVKSFTVVYAGYFGIQGIFRAIGIDL
ncbi:MAG: VTT domain-containing protein [Dehalococcoidales bacterium]|nr:VTT domain-containing protein [Dehalococcoidales bacterium]